MTAHRFFLAPERWAEAGPFLDPEESRHFQRVLRGQPGEGIEVFRDRSLADEDGHALFQLLARLGGRGRLVIGANAGGEVAVERQIDRSGAWPSMCPPWKAWSLAIMP